MNWTKPKVIYPFPNVGSPYTMARLLSFNAPANISLALAVPLFTWLGSRYLITHFYHIQLTNWNSEGQNYISSEWTRCLITHFYQIQLHTFNHELDEKICYLQYRNGITGKESIELLNTPYPITAYYPQISTQYRVYDSLETRTNCPNPIQVSLIACMSCKSYFCETN